ncbi:ATP-binding cassette sub-family A member 3-like [Teleopsis dalmanni]|uniref:ATP-binding cassette sub-family A member 3-like n=1 Tax=Teleopsis dalmanni TaxID=139649 RepID=UPI0018CF0F73|nr:ATP-binding cassette sub-family A member 3-like [Teleopsis dalmanni]
MELHYSPENPILEKIIQLTTETLNISTYKGHQNAAALENYLTKANYFAGIQFEDSLSQITEYPKQISFAIRFPSELRTISLSIDFTWLTNSLFMPIDLSGPRGVDDADGGVPVGYIREGFLPLQNALSLAYIKLASGAESLPEIIMQRFPYPDYIYDPLLQGITTLIPTIVLLCFIYSAINTTKNVTMEKEKQLKEVMKVMGLSNWLHWVSWFVKAFLILAITSILVVVLFKIRWSNDVAVLTYSSWTAMIFFMWIYSITTICFCFMLSTFFSKASTAAAVAGLGSFITYLPFSLLLYSYDDLSLAEKLLWSLLSNSGMGFGFKVILSHEGSGEGLQWSNMFDAATADDSLSLGAVILVMLGASILYMLICLYVEQIFPGDFGVPQKWNFPFTKTFWCGVDNVDFSDNDIGIERQNPDAFEAEPKDKHVGIHVKNLKKQFGEKTVVKGLNVKMFENEITVLLGHNGAGKTTTISMLIGMFPPTAGTATINGSDVRTNTQGARMSLGICPQHNVLFDDLSVANHIVFFSRLKGLRGAAIQREVAKYLKMIELEDKANVASSKLSGGMKRKLSVCCALCGDTKVVLCDEPSSGMDPAARRQLWDLLQAEKVGRTLLLTTHFMDEADVLGDRIAIMCDGELKCHGTSFFLKKKYGSGYHLICVKRDNCDASKVTSLLNEFIPNLQPESDIGAELSYLLPDSHSDKFEQMFGALELRSDELQLSGYGVGISSMEEVFMKVGAENSSDGEAKQHTDIMNFDYGNLDRKPTQFEHILSNNGDLLIGTGLLKNQWQAMFLKKILYTIRNKLLFLIQNLMPIVFIIITIIFSNEMGFGELPAMTMHLTQYPDAVTVLETKSNLAENSIEAKLAEEYAQIAKSFGKSYKFETTESKSFGEYILDLSKSIIARINSRYLAAATVDQGKITAWLNNQPLHTAPLSLNFVHNALAKATIDPNAAITVTNKPLPYTTQTLLNQLNIGQNLGMQMATNLCFCMCFVSAFYILFLIKERESRSKLLQFVSGVKVWTFWLTQILWDMLTFILTAILIIITLACFQEDGLATFAELGRYFLVLLIFGFSVLPFTYWISTYFAEPATGFGRISIINIFCGMALFIVITVISFDFFDTKDTADALQWVFRIFPQFSLASSLNKLYSNGATRDACEGQNSGENVESFCRELPQCCNIEPYFSWNDPGILPEIIYMLVVGVIFFLIVVIQDFGYINEIIYKLRNKNVKTPPTTEDGYLDEDVLIEQQRVISMSSTELLKQNLVLDRVTKYYNKFLAVNQISLCVKHSECFGLLGVNGAGKTTTFKMMTGDERITSGVAYVRGMNLETERNKVYKEIGYCPQFDALIDDLTGRETLKIFCLLRGIQKEKIEMLSEELADSFGFRKHLDKETKAYSGGNKRKLSTAIAVLGGPAVVFLDEPTSGMDPAARRQLWNMICRIRDSGKSIVLTSHSMEECEALCTRLAVMVNGEFKCIGSTQHLKNKFSKGIVLKVKVQRSTISNNRYSYNEGEELAQIFQQNIQNVKNFVEQQFSNSVLQEEYQGILTFYIPLTGMRWSQIFGLMERNCAELNIEDYSISQTTLEEIFLEFAKYQKEDKRAN